MYFVCLVDNCVYVCGDGGVFGYVWVCCCCNDWFGLCCGCWVGVGVVDFVGYWVVGYDCYVVGWICVLVVGLFDC